MSESHGWAARPRMLIRVVCTFCVLVAILTAILVLLAIGGAAIACLVSGYVFWGIILTLAFIFAFSAVAVVAEHVVGAPCWCDPFNDDGVRVHNSADRREEYERGRKAS